MREISPAENLTCDEFLEMAPPEFQATVEKIRKEKRSNARPLPSSKIIDSSTFLEKNVRLDIIDKVSMLVDENLFGRSEMCFQFASLLYRALNILGLKARPVVGTAIYYLNSQEIFRWKHAWVRVGQEVIDVNVDSIFENPMVPHELILKPYWGEITKTPKDRKLKESTNEVLPYDKDVLDIWFPELEKWLYTKYSYLISSKDK